MIYFVVIFVFVRRTIIDVLLVRNIPFDILITASLLLFVFNRIHVNISSINVYVLILSFLIGTSISSLERFFVGFLFHYNQKIEFWHEPFHEELRNRKVTGIYLFWEHFSEVIAYSLVFVIYNNLFKYFNHSIFYGLWVGILFEHYIGAEFRLHVQYVDIKIWDKSFFKKFYYNIEIYYWYHIMVNTQTCFGFSSPFWDTLFGRNPFKSRFIFSSPLPFIDFLFVDYSDEYQLIQNKFEEYQLIPNRFEEYKNKKII